jgi:hypothetical protein
MGSDGWVEGRPEQAGMGNHRLEGLGRNARCVVRTGGGRWSVVARFVSIIHFALLVFQVPCVLEACAICVHQLLPPLSCFAGRKGLMALLGCGV